MNAQLQVWPFLEMGKNDTKMGLILTGTWPTSQIQGDGI